MIVNIDHANLFFIYLWTHEENNVPTDKIAQSYGPLVVVSDSIILMYWISFEKQLRNNPRNTYFMIETAL